MKHQLYEEWREKTQTTKCLKSKIQEKELFFERKFKKLEVSQVFF